MSKLLTVIVPSYNMEVYLPKGLQSLVVNDNSVLQKLDVIVVNDGSKDNTSEIAHEFEAQYPDVFRVIDKPNGHYGSCINAALPMAKGTFVKIMDADDSFDTALFTTFLKFLDSVEPVTSHSTDVVFTDYVRVDDKGTVIGEYLLNLPREGVFSLDAIPKACVERMWMPSVTYRTDIFRRITYRQMEGMPYTDQQWIFYPMSVVQYAQYCPIALYRYFIGRVGQTVDDTYYEKHFGVIRNLTERMIKDFPAIAKNSVRPSFSYLKHRLYARILLVYRYHLFHKSNEFDGTESDLVAFDQKLRDTLPEFYEQTGQVRYFRRIPISLVSAWRRKISGHPLQYMFLIYILIPIASLRCKLLSLFSTRG